MAESGLVLAKGNVCLCTPLLGVTLVQLTELWVFALGVLCLSLSPGNIVASYSASA